MSELTRPVVWIADDSAMERAITQRALGEHYAYEQFADGSEVIERLSAGSQPPDVLLLDWVMPGMSGDEVCRFLRAQAGTRDLPIIMVTGSRLETDDVVQGLALGANDYVARPFAVEELRARVAAVLRTKQLHDESRAERKRLATINRLGHALFEAGTSLDRILEQLALTLTGALCDGCAIVLLPGRLRASMIAHHPIDPGQIAEIGMLADPAVHEFNDVAHARATLPPAYHGYIDRFGLRSLAILPFPILTPVEGVVTVTRDSGSAPFDAHDLAAIETCIEYTSLAVERAIQFDAERSARAQLHAVVEHAPIGILVADATGTINLTNPQLQMLVPGVELARHLDDVYRLGEWSTEAGPVASSAWSFGRVARDDAPAHAELVLHAASGRPPRRLSMTTVALREGEALAGTMTVVEDVTAARQLEEERERVSLFQEQMLGIVGHDLRNPLGAIVNGAAAIEHHGQGHPQITRIVTLVNASARRMTRIVDQLLDVTRARLGGGLTLHRTRIELRSVARSVLEELGSVHRQARFELVAGPEVEGMWDADRVGQVLANLGGNAAQYGDPAVPIRVTVGLDGDTAVLAVHNAIRGEPVAYERLTALFEPFRRGREQAQHVSGLGLGLYIVSEIARAHGGTIEAESSLAGTTFTVRLPQPALLTP